jgi:hypothetical protein
MPGSRLEISIEARDNASATLDSVRNKLQLFDQYGHTVSDLTSKTDGLTQATEAHVVSMTHSTRAVRELTGPLLTGLSPALGQTASQLLFVVQGASMLSSGMGALALVAAGTGGIVGGQLVESLRKAEQQFEDLRKAQTGLDFQTLVSGATAARTAVEDLGDQLDRLGKLQKEIAATPDPSGRAASFALGSVLGTDTAGVEHQRQLDLWIARGQRTALFQAGRQASSFAEAENVVSPEQNAATIPMALDANRRIADIQRQVAEVGILDPIERTFQAAVRDANSGLLTAPGAEGAKVRDEAVRLATTQRDEALRLRSAGTLGRDLVEPGQGFEQAIAGATDEMTRAGLDAKRWAAGLKLLRESLERDVIQGAEMEAITAGLQPGEESKFRKEALQRRTEELGIFQQTAQLQLESVGLSRDQSRAIEEEVIARQHALELAKAGNDEDKQNLANLRAAAAITKLNERDQAVPGLMRGLADMEIEFGSVGLRMQSLARGVADGMANSFSDGFFDVLTGNFKSLPDVARSFTNSMVRAVTDELAKLITAPILGQLKGVLGDLFGGGSGPFPFGSGSGGGGPLGLATAPAGPTNIFLTTTGRPLSQAELQTAYAAGGPQGVLALQQGAAVVSGGQFVPASGFGELPGPSIPSGGPSLLSRALPIVGSAAALGLTALAARGNTSDLGTGVSAGMGALTGATLGVSLANLLPSLGISSGVGAAGGALAGAAISGTLAALAKAEADKQAAKARQQAEIARAAGAGSDLVSSASSATSVADLFRRITAFGSGTSGGTANPAVPVDVMTPGGMKTIGFPNAAFPTATLSDLIANPGTLRANIQAGVSPEALAGPNAATSQALQGMATDLVKQFRQTEQGVSVTQEDLLAPSGLRRRTSVPASRVGALGTEGGALQIDALALGALSDDDKAALLLDILNHAAQNQDIVSTISDGATGTITSITRIPKSTITLPPATTPPPAPVTSPGSVGQTPPTSTGELLTAGGALTLALATQLADPASLLNKILPAGFTGPDLAQAIQNLVTTGSLSGAAGAVTVQDLINQGEGLSTVFNDAGAGGVGAGGAVGGAVSGLAGLYSLVQGIQQGDAASIAKGVFDLYNAASTLLPSTIPNLGALAADAFAALAPETATAIVEAAGGTISGAAATGTEVAAALAPAAGALAAFAPLVAGLIIWATTQKMSDLRDWAAIGQTATTLQTQARLALSQAAGLFTAIDAQHVTDPTVLKQAIQLGSSALLAYHQTVQGPAGPIGVGDFYRLTGQDPGPIQQQAAAVQTGILKAIAVLEQGGATAASLGSLAPAAWGNPDLAGSRRANFFTPQQANTAATQTLGLIGGPEGTGSFTQQVGEGDVTMGGVPTGGVAAGVAALGAFAPDRAMLAGENAQLPADTTNLEFGGPLWAMLAYLLGPTGQPESGGGTYYQTLAQQGVIAPTFTPAQIAASYAQMIAAIAASQQQAFTSGGM